MAQNEEKTTTDVVSTLKVEIAKLRKEVAAKDDEITLLKRQVSELKSGKQAQDIDEDKNKVTYQCTEKCFYQNVLYKKGDLVRFPKDANVPEYFSKV